MLMSVDLQYELNKGWLLRHLACKFLWAVAVDLTLRKLEGSWVENDQKSMV